MNFENLLTTENISTIGGFLLSLVWFLLGYKKTGKFDREAFLGLFIALKDIDFKGKNLKSQNHYNEPSKELEQATEVAKLEVDSASSPEFFNPKPGKRITSRFGYRTLAGRRSFHDGIDLAGGGDCIAVEDCVIEKIIKPDEEYPVRFRWTKKGFVKIDVPSGRAWTPYLVAIGQTTGTKYVYKHIRTDRQVGSTVKAGEKICIADNLGYSMGAHLHLETWEMDKNTKQHKTKPTNPETYFKQIGIMFPEKNLI